MEKIKEFFVKNKATIISVLSAVLTFVIALSKIDMGAKVGVVVSILLVVLPVIISIIGGNDMENTIKLLVNAITMIQQIIKAQKPSEEKVVGASEDTDVEAEVEEEKDVLELTEEEIKELLVKGL